MRIKKYVADSMPEALKQVKADLGPRAVILNTRTLRKGGKFGLGKKGQVEVTAAVDTEKPVAKKTAAKTHPAKKTQRSTEPPAPGPAGSAKPARPRQLPAAAFDRLSKQIENLQAVLRSNTLQGLFLPGALETLSQQMESTGLRRSISEEILKEILIDPGDTGLKDLKPLQNRAVRMICERFPKPAPTCLTKGVRSVVALVGPAGAGKTTSAARIAAHFAQSDASVVLVAADTDRVGGLEQIRAYAGILNIPVDVAYTSEELGEIIGNRRETDLILIDTAGMGPTDAEGIAKLNDLLKEAAPNEIHLTLGAPTDLQQMRDIVSAFTPLGIDRLLFTKLDEAVRWGAICTLGIESNLCLSFTTDGRAVPGNLNPADPTALSSGLFWRSPND